MQRRIFQCKQFLSNAILLSYKHAILQYNTSLLYLNILSKVSFILYLLQKQPSASSEMEPLSQDGGYDIVLLRQGYSTACGAVHGRECKSFCDKVFVMFFILKERKRRTIVIITNNMGYNSPTWILTGEFQYIVPLLEGLQQPQARIPYELGLSAALCYNRMMPPIYYLQNKHLFLYKIRQKFQVSEIK